MSIEIVAQLVGALLTAIGVVLTWRVLRNQERSENPIITARLDEAPDLPPGWHRLVVMVRNRSPYRWDGESVQLRHPRGLRLVPESAAARPDGVGGRRFDPALAEPLLARSAPMQLAVASAGTTSKAGSYGTEDFHWEVFMLRDSGRERSFSMRVSLRSTEAKPRRIASTISRALIARPITDTV